jgi:lipopolysaccharide export system permease protein
VILYIGTYEKNLKRAYRMTLEKFDGKTLVSRTTAQFADYDTLGHFELRKWVTRDFVGMQETMTSGERKDTTLNVDTEDFFVRIDREINELLANADKVDLSVSFGVDL